ncbi:MAG: type IV toxin-antitoxin system AbiEi family antitoxin domain-containing protein, partial [Jatrophihabitantaceae bacterium]
MDGAPDPDWYFANVLDHGEADVAGRGRSGAWQLWWRKRWVEADGPCAVLAREQGFVLTTGQARALGVARHDIRRQVRRGLWTPVARGAVATLAIPNSAKPQLDARRRHALTAAAAALLRPGHVIAGASATVLHGLPTLDLPDVPELVARRDTTTGRRSRAHVRHAELADADVTTWFGAPAATVARSIADLAGRDRRSGLIAADAALRERLARPGELSAVLERRTGRRGTR